MNRLIDVDRGQYVDEVFAKSRDYESWTLDGAGNILSHTLSGTTTNETANTANEITSVGSTSLAHDAAG